MKQSVAFLGRQPALGLAELERLYGADALHPLPGGLVLLDKHHSEIDFARLGGSIKFGKVLTRIDHADWKKVVAHLCKNVPEHLQYFPEGKLRLGLNNYGFDVSVNDINRAGLQVKKVIKNAGRSVRVVPNTSATLSSAQTLHNQLTGPTGLELAAIKDGADAILVQIVASQDIDAYAARDQARPKRDSRVGMLPPKLAQIIVNLANPAPGNTVLDPFCGTGVVLQEAELMGFNTYGTDIDPRMVEYTQANLNWLTESKDFTPPATSRWLEVGDAATYPWPHHFDVIAAETYLGRPFSAVPDSTKLQEVMNDVNFIHKKFLKNVAIQTKPGFQMCIAVPAWHTNSGVKHLKMLDSLEELGYTRMSFVHAETKDLVYHRENQVVGRELVVLIRK